MEITLLHLKVQRNFRLEWSGMFYLCLNLWVCRRWSCRSLKFYSNHEFVGLETERRLLLTSCFKSHPNSKKKSCRVLQKILVRAQKTLRHNGFWCRRKERSRSRKYFQRNNWKSYEVQMWISLQIFVSWEHYF